MAMIVQVARACRLITQPCVDSSNAGQAGTHLHRWACLPATISDPDIPILSLLECLDPLVRLLIKAGLETLRVGKHYVLRATALDGF